MTSFLFDVDGVCVDFMGYLLQEMTGELGYCPIAYDEVRSHDFLSGGGPLTKEQLAIARKIVCAEGFAGKLPLLPGCKQTIRNIHNLGFEVKFVTSPYHSAKTWCHDRYVWVEKTFPFLDAKKSLIFATDKAPVSGSFFLDDKPSNVEEWGAKNGVVGGFVFPQPWNEGLPLPYADWDFVNNHANELARKYNAP